MRDRILTAAAKEMGIKGIKFTMNDLAAHLGISKRSIYEYFSSKEEIIGALVDENLENIMQQCNDILNNKEYDLPQKLKMIILAHQKNAGCGYGRDAEEIKRFCPREWEKIERHLDDKWKIIEKILQEGIEQKLFRPVYVPCVKKIIKGAINESIDSNFLIGNQVQLTKLYEYMVDVILYGIIDQNTTDKSGI